MSSGGMTSDLMRELRGCAMACKVDLRGIDEQGPDAI
jgi:hypothetical protein